MVLFLKLIELDSQMRKIIKMSVIIIWAYLVCWLFSALVHSTDSDINGLQGLWTSSVILSVSAIALIFFALIMCAALMYRIVGRRGFLWTLAIFSFGFGLMLTLGGFGGGSAGQWLFTLISVSALFLLVSGIALFPMLLKYRFKAKFDQV